MAKKNRPRQMEAGGHPPHQPAQAHPAAAPKLPPPVGQLVVQQTSAFSGPLPPPEVVARYAEIAPDWPERIIAMAEKEGDHRRACEAQLVAQERTEMELTFRQKGRGQLYGFCIALAGLGLTAWFGAAGKEVVASVLGGGTVLGLVTVFVTGRLTRAKPEDSDEGVR